FDGQTFRSYTTKDGLAHNEVSSVSEDKDGNLWFGTEGGVSCFDGQTFRNLTTEDGLAHNSVSDIYQDENGHWWFATEGGVSRYTGQYFTTFTTGEGLGANWCRKIYCDQDGCLWFVTDGGGASCYDGDAFTTFTTKDGLVNDTVLSVYQDRNGLLWFGTMNGVSTYDGVRFQNVPDLLNRRVRAMLEDKEGHLWFGTLSGVVRYDPHTFTSYQSEGVEADDGVWAMFSDKNERIWFSPFGGGVSYFDGDQIRAITLEDGLPEPVAMSIGQDDQDRMWFGMWETGLCCHDGETITCFTEQDGLGGNRVWCMLQDHRDGAMWFAAWGGLTRFDGESFETWTVENGLLHNRIRSMIQDKKGNIWLGTFAGVNRFDGQQFHTITEADGLPDNSVWSILEDRHDNIWFGTNNGATRYDGKTFTSIGVTDGLASNCIWRIQEDLQGRLLFGTNGGGVTVYDGEVFQTLTSADGLSGNVVQSIIPDKKGNIWFGTNNGVTRYQMPDPTPPGIAIQAIIADKRYEQTDSVTVLDSVTLIAFEFRGLSYKTRPEAMVYRYRLKDYDQAWYTTNKGRVEYEALPVGNYTFEVCAIDRDLVYSKTPCRVTLTVERDTRDAQIDELEARVQERTALLVQAEKKSALGSLVAGIAHEINNPAGALTSAMDVLHRGIRKLDELLDEDDRQTRRILNLLKDSTSGAQMASSRIARVVKNLRNFARLDEAEYQKVDLHEGLDSTIELLLNELEGRISIVKNYGDIPNIYCYPAELNQLFMNIISNAIESIDGRGIITLNTKTQESNVTIEISDNGRGMPPEVVTHIFEPGFKAGHVQVGTGLGLSISANIVEKHGGQITVDSKVDEGSTFTVQIPIRQ
ncbi:MAG: GHKL domain-containing protein, partial [Candidatus Latescibacteria bacterium]|nr:GHKL domain-containing protein [Candidatus Latescibacterota bacterium]